MSLIPEGIVRYCWVLPCCVGETVRDDVVRRVLLEDRGSGDEDEQKVR